MSDYYILIDKKPVAVPMFEWAEWFENAGEERIIKQDEVKDKFISTVFLGLNHNWNLNDDHRPHLFETMVFKQGGYAEIYCTRCATWEEAEAQHAKAIEWVKEGCKNDER